MPRVPTAEGFGVLPTIRSGGARPVLSVEQAAQPGRQMEARGAQMMQVGGAVADYALKQQERVNRVRVQDAYLTAEREALALGQQLQDLKGKDAVGASDVFTNKLQETLGKLEQEIGSDAAKMMFRERTGVLQNRFFESTLKYEAEQLDVYEALVLDATVGSAFEAISQDVANLPSQSEAARAALTQKYQNAGLSGEPLNQRVRADMGKLHGVVIDNMLDAGDGAGAKAYFEAVRETDMLEMDADAWANKVNAGAAVSNGRTMVDAFMAGTSMEDLNLVEADAYFRANGTNDKEIDAARAELITRRRLFQEQEKLQDADNYDTALEIASRNGLGAAKGSAAWQSLTTKDQLSITDYLESRYETRSSRARAAKEREQVDAYWDVVHSQTETQNLGTMSEGDFRALRPKVGEANFEKLKQERKEFQQDPTKALAVTLDNNKFDKVAFDYGFNVVEPKPEEKLQLSLLRSALKDAISVEQQRVGRTLTPEEKDKVISRTFRDNMRQMLSRASGLAPGEVRLGAVGVPDIPEKEVDMIVEALGRAYAADPTNPRNDPSKDENIVALYLEMNSIYGTGEVEE